MTFYLIDLKTSDIYLYLFIWNNLKCVYLFIYSFIYLVSLTSSILIRTLSIIFFLINSIQTFIFILDLVTSSNKIPLASYYCMLLYNSLDPFSPDLTENNDLLFATDSFYSFNLYVAGLIYNTVCVDWLGILLHASAQFRQ